MVVLKAVTEEHKTRLGLVITNLRSSDQVTRAWLDLCTRSVPPFLVQEQVPAGPEVIVGVRRDPIFGAVVVLGFGGRFAEAFAGREIRLAPVPEADANQMVVGLLGEPLEQLSDILVKVSHLIAERPSVQDLELNPVILGPSGPCAVDLRRFDGPTTTREDSSPNAQHAIERMLRPRSVAIIGASRNLEKPGGRALRYLRRSAPDLPVYAVNPRRETIEGVQAVGQVAELPLGIDVAVIALPGRYVVSTLEGLHQRHIPSAIVFASGFAEAGNDIGEEEVRATSRRLGIRVCGVNSNGVVGDVPLTFSQAGGEPSRVGSVSFVTQSGALSGSLLMQSWALGLGTARAVCVGNQTDLEISDYLYFLADDDATRTIGVFLEGVRDGRRLADSMARVTRNGKGLVVLRAGAMAVSSLAARSHTGILAGSPEIYRQVIGQAGGAVAEDITDLVGMCQALDWQPHAASRRIAIISTSGGAGSLIADMVEQRGMLLPELESDVQDKLREVLPSFATTRNPIDTTAAITYAPELLGLMAEPVLASKEVDLLLIAISTLTGRQAETIAGDMVRLASRSSKPIVIGWSLPESAVGPAVAMLRRSRVPVFNSFTLAASAASALTLGA
jgi:acyl-CoA synthetase (NDP forming)